MSNISQQALEITEEPADQKQIPHPRLGFCGVIDERMDIELLGEIAEMRPDWQFVMIGPVVKIAKKICRAARIFIISAAKNTKNCPRISLVGTSR